MARPALRIAGEVSGCPDCDTAADIIAGLERDIRGWAARTAILKREKDQQARDHHLWDVLEALYAVWRRECGHMKSRFASEDFWQALPHFERYGWDGCETAIAGAKFDCWRTRRRNGRWKRHDDWSLNIFKDRAHVEEFMKRAPQGFEPSGLPSRFSADSSGKVVAQVGAAPRKRPAPGTNGVTRAAVDA